MISLLIVLFCVFHDSLALYEDQIGKFDWKLELVGEVNHVHYDESGKIVVATEKNVLALLNLRNGSVAWRQLLEKGPHEKVQSLQGHFQDVITVQGRGEFIRCWDLTSGVMKWETFLPNNPTDSSSIMKIHVAAANKQVLLVEMQPGGGIQAFVYNMREGTLKKSPKAPAPWLTELTSCEFVSHKHLACVESVTRTVHVILVEEGGCLFSASLTSLGLRSSDIRTELKIKQVANQETAEHPLFTVELGNSGLALLQLQSAAVKTVKVFPGAADLSTALFDGHLYLFVLLPKVENYKVLCLDTSSWTELQELEGTLHIPSHRGNVKKMLVLPFLRKDKEPSYKLLLTFEDHSLVLVHQHGKVFWSREEALTSVVSVEIVDLPLSDTDAKIEQEFEVAGADVTTALITRLTTQALQLQTFLLGTLTGLGRKGSFESGTSELIRDKFGLHKVLVFVSASGKIFGIDSLTGTIIWQTFVPDLVPFSEEGQSSLPLFVSRTTAHIPFFPQCTVLGKHKRTGQGYIFTFHPITGQTVDQQVLSYKVIQNSILGYVNSEFLRGILLLDDELKVHVYPKSCERILDHYKDVHFIYTVDVKTGTLSGYKIAESDRASPIWKVILPVESQKIIKIAVKNPSEHVHSQGRVMGDRSVLYKYLNPNLMTVVTEGNDPVTKSTLNIYLIDAVTGSIIYSASHKRSRGPVHVVHSENWVVYNYYNEKYRRTEISSIELYEGKMQSNTTAFSSLNPPFPPLVEHQTYIFPCQIDAMAHTLTERGITNKHLIIAMPTGALLELPKAFLDPRRPVHPLPEHREEGLIPYIPELPVPAEGIINYNLTVNHIRGIHTAPSGLESTGLIIAYGLDIFYARVTPSKTFDILKDDFEHFLISAVLSALLLVSYVTKKLAARKALRAAWK